jgi:hypothetical protein
MDENLEWKFYYWGPYLWKTKINKSVCDELLERAKKSNIKHNQHLAGLIEKEFSYREEDKKWFVQQMNPYFNAYFKCGDFWYKEITKKNLNNLWINYMEKGEFNPDHTHDGDISFVIYLQIPEVLKEENKQNISKSSGPGSISFSYGEETKHYINGHSFFPEETDLFIFPATLRHMVLPFKSDCVRISVSGNLEIE